MTVTEEEEVPLMKNDRAGSQKSSCDSTLQVHLYYTPTVKSETTLSIPTGHMTAESVCVFAAKASGEKLLLHNGNLSRVFSFHHLVWKVKSLSFM